MQVIAALIPPVVVGTLFVVLVISAWRATDSRSGAGSVDRKEKGVASDDPESRPAPADDAD